MAECLNGTGAVASAGEQPAGGEDLTLDVVHGVGGAGGHSDVFRVEHFEIVVAVADGEAAFDGDAVAPGNMGEAAAFLEIPVAETQINRVSLPRELRFHCDQRVNVADDPRHFVFRLGDDPRWFAISLNPAGACVFLDFTAEADE